MSRRWIILGLVLIAACMSKNETPASFPETVESEAGYVDDFDVEVAQAAAIADEILVIERDRTVTPTDDEPLGGELRAKVDGQETEIPLPLKHTDVKGKLSLHVGSVEVRQSYHNPYDAKIEAVYVFPLPQNAAISDFIMQIGDRKIRGIVREREEARKIYEAARRQGHVASLLSQDRPNIFTQAVANIEPGKSIDIRIAYFQTLRYEEGSYEFVFPMVVGPRFNPPGSTGGVGAVPRGASGRSGQKSEVSYLRANEISAHRISLTVDVDLGCDLGELASPSHAIDIAWKGGKRRATVSLKKLDRIPNRDFVLRYRVADEEVYGTIATHRDRRGGYFTLVLQPPAKVDDLPRMAREMVFVVDCSGSMRGEPMAACQRAIRRCLKRLEPNDTFQVIRFSNDASTMGAKPVRATADNIATEVVNRS